MGTCYVVNDLPQETIVVTEGSGSTFLKVTSIPPGKYCMVSVDSKATFRQFSLVLVPGTLQAVLNSDDCQECAEVRITGYNASELICKKTLKVSRDVSGMTTDANLSNAWQSVLRFFGIGRKQRKRLAPAPQPASASQPGGASQSTAAPQPTGASQSMSASHPAGASQPAVAAEAQQPPKVATTQLVEVSQAEVAPRDRSSAKLAEVSQLAVAAPDGGSAPTGSSVPDGGSAQPKASQLVDASQANGATETDGGEDQATVRVICS